MIPVDLTYEAAFWGNRFVEHATFTFQGLVDAPLKTQAGQIVRRGMSRDLSLVDSTAALANALNAFHTPLLARLTAGNWLGFLYPSLIVHMLREQNWYLGLLKNQWSVRDLICFGNQDAGEAAEVGSKFMDPNPSFAQFAIGARQQSDRFMSIAQMCKTDPLSLLAAKSIAQVDYLSAFVSLPQMASVLSIAQPGLVVHDVLEAKHFAALLKQLTANGQLQ